MTANGRMGGKILADGLKAQGVDAIFGVPGESFLALLDGLYDQRNTIRFITCRQEGGAANMAEAYGKIDRASWSLCRHPGPGSNQCQLGASHRIPGLDTHDFTGWASRAGNARPGSLSGSESPDFFSVR